MILHAHWKSTFANLRFGFLFTLGDPPSLVWQKTTLFPDFFSRHTPLSFKVSIEIRRRKLKVFSSNFWQKMRKSNWTSCWCSTKTSIKERLTMCCCKDFVAILLVLPSLFFLQIYQFVFTHIVKGKVSKKSDPPPSPRFYAWSRFKNK